MKVGIVGLPNVGKSTVFNSLTRAGAEAQNYPFTTIDPNLGVAVVPDGRLPALAEVMASKKVVPATVDFVDIAGLVRGASAGEGLGNQFLAHIRECDAVAHVVRCFEDENVVHVHGGVDPVGDAETINTELLLADLATVERRLERVGRAAKSGDPRLKAEVAGLEKLRDHLSGGAPARSFTNGSEVLAETLRSLITAKPVLYVANVDEESVADGNRCSSEVEKLAAREGAEALRISAKLEAEVVELPEEEVREYLGMLGVESTGFEGFVRAAYRLLGLITFFTAAEKEARAWTVREGSTARRAGSTPTWSAVLSRRRWVTGRTLWPPAPGRRPARRRRCASKAATTSSRTATSCSSASTSESCPRSSGQRSHSRSAASRSSRPAESTCRSNPGLT